MKGKGKEQSLHVRGLALAPGRSVMTQLTGTMRFVELSQSLSVPGSIGAPGEIVRELPDVLPVSH
jgi:hypothetical protein